MERMAAIFDNLRFDARNVGDLVAGRTGIFT